MTFEMIGLMSSQFRQLYGNFCPGTENITLSTYIKMDHQTFQRMWANSAYQL